MKNLSRLTLVLGVAVIVLGAHVASASARRFVISNPSWRTTWNIMTFSAAGAEISCRVTLEGSFHSSTIEKVVGSLVGYVTRATVHTEGCISGRVIILQERLPWHVRYASFSGTLPDITTIRANVIGAAFRFVSFLECLSISTAANPVTATFNLVGSPVNSVTVGGSIPCGGITGTVSGTSRIPTVLNSTTELSVRLI
jgi:hypothetical protein